MLLHEQFIPGRWIDDIDVNDFIKLNKKPFLDKPKFLHHPFGNSDAVDGKYWLEEEQKVDLSFSSLDSKDVNWLPLTTDSPAMKRKIGHSENPTEISSFYLCHEETEHSMNTSTTTHEVYKEIATSDMNKMFRIGLFHQHPFNYTPMFVYPDIRIVPLYGTKEIIKEKRHYLTKLERYLQTTEWIQQRISKQKEIQALKQFEKFARNLGVNVSKPAESTKEAIDMLYVTLLSVTIENPSVAVNLSDIPSFLDVYTEKELSLGLITEEDVQNWIDEWIVKVNKLRFTPSPNLDASFPSSPFFLGDTFGESVTKMTYRFLSALERHYEAPFALRIIWSEQLPESLKSCIFSMYDKGIPFQLVSPRTIQNLKNPVLLPYGIQSEAFHEISFHGGACDLVKSFYLAMNGGKDFETNTNLSTLTTPLREGQVNYEEMVRKFHDFLSFVILSYTETMNVLLYLHDIQQIHPLRSSLISNQPFYSVSFGFFGLKTIVNWLAAAQRKELLFEQKNGKLFMNFKSKNSTYEEEDVIMTHLISLIKNELKKIPLYKEAKHRVRFYTNGMYDLIDSKDINYQLTLPPEYMKGNFHVNIHKETLDESFIKKLFSSNITELNASKSDTFYMANGLLFHKDYQLRK